MKKTPEVKDIGFAKLDFARRARTGFGETVFGPGKTPEQMVGIFRAFREKKLPVLATRCTAEQAEALAVADVPVYAGETGDVLFKDPAVPFGYACETVGTDVLMDSLHVKAGRLYTDAGLNARMLYLQDARMSLPVLNKISEFAAQGAFIGGVKPANCLKKDDETVFQRTVEKVWLTGNVMSGRTVKSILKAAGVKPDVKTKADSLYFQHRRLPEIDIYRICNLGESSGNVKLRFRVQGRQPFQWNPDTGEITPVSYKLKKRSTKVTLRTVPGDDTFLVFGSFAERKKLKVK